MTDAMPLQDIPIMSLDDKINSWAEGIFIDDMVHTSHEGSRPTHVNTIADPTELVREELCTSTEENGQTKLMNHVMQKACDRDLCKKKCADITELDRMEIWEAFWKLKKDDRLAWVFYHVKTEKTKEQTVVGKQSRRNHTYRYYLTHTDGDVEVCKVMFLTTLGYKKTNDRLIKTAMKYKHENNISAPKDMRGRHRLGQKSVHYGVVRDHINSFNPSISHYRREHAPNRLYLPSEITITLMHDDFKEKFPDKKCSFTTYRDTVRNMNISFIKLGEEECEICLRRQIQCPNGAKQNEGQLCTCEVCAHYKIHIESANRARERYKADAVKDGNETSVKSVDLQKVIMLPRLPGNKTAIFTKRITTYHETFASVGKGKRNSKGKSKTISVVWHEGISGRSASDITSCFYMFLKQERDAKDIILWLDNYSSQNKNWTLFTMLANRVNSADINAEEISLRYFVPGHSFMSADSVHAGVEKKMKQRPGGKVLDFDDFAEVVKCSDNQTVIKMCYGDFKIWEKGLSLAKKKSTGKFLLKDIAEIIFRRGSKEMWFRTEHDESVVLTGFDFLKKGIQMTLPESHKENKGIEADKKKDLVNLICPLLPLNRQSFYENL